MHQAMSVACWAFWVVLAVGLARVGWAFVMAW